MKINSGKYKNRPFKPVFKSGYCINCKEYLLGVRLPIPSYLLGLMFFGSLILLVILLSILPETINSYSVLFAGIIIINLIWTSIYLFKPVTSFTYKRIRCSKCGARPPIWGEKLTEDPQSHQKEESIEIPANLKNHIGLDRTGIKNRSEINRIRKNAVLVFLCLLSFNSFVVLFRNVPWWVLPFYGFLMGILYYYCTFRFAGWKNDVLYLRRFRTSGETDWITVALEKGLDKKYRSITLHGGDLESIDSSIGRSRFNIQILVYVFSSLAITFLIYEGLQELSFGRVSYDDIILRFFLSTHLFFFLGYFSAILSFRKLSHQNEIASDEALSEWIQRRIRVKKWQFASNRAVPPLEVIKVSDLMWQKAVLESAQMSDFVIIDVSKPSEALLWEINNAKELFNEKAVYVAHKLKFISWYLNEVEKLYEIDEKDLQFAQPIRDLICKNTILLYDKSGPLKLSLSNFLDNQPRNDSARAPKFSMLDYVLEFFKLKKGQDKKRIVE